MQTYTTQMDAARKGILTKEMEIAAGKEQGIDFPQREPAVKTNFIR